MVDYIICEYTNTSEKHIEKKQLTKNTNPTFATMNVGSAATIDPSAVSQADSTTKGALFPRMTTVERDLIASPATGLVIYNITLNKLQVYDGTRWLYAHQNTDSYLFRQGTYPETYTSSDTYVVVGNINWRGSDIVSSPTNIEVIARADLDTCSVRIYDVTNALIIAEKTAIPTGSTAIYDLGILSNISTGSAIWEVQIKSDNASATSYGNISEVSIIW